MNRIRALALLVLSFAWASAGEAWPRDRIHDLVDELKPPARFSGHRPAWSVGDETVTFNHVSGPRETRFKIIRDGAGIVAVIPLREFYDGSIFLQAFRPEDTKPTMSWPKGRWHIDTSVGSELRTLGLIPRNLDGSDVSYAVSEDGSTLVYRRRFTGLTDSRKGEMQGGTPKGARLDVDLDYTFTFRVDPVHGYVVEGRYLNRSRHALSGTYMASSAPGGRYAMWPGQRTSYATVVAIAGEPGFTGWYSNMGAIPQAGGALRGRQAPDGGFAAYLDDRSGWSSCVTSVGNTAGMVVCNAHSDVDFEMRWPKAQAPAADGWHTYTIHHRLVGLPPELTAHLGSSFKPLFAGQTRVQVRLGVTEDFETQPLPMDGRETGTAFGGAVVQGQAHSGDRCLVVDGQAGSGGAQVALLPATTYRVEAWLRLTPWSPADIAQRQQAHDARRAEALAKRAALEAKGDGARAAKVAVPPEKDFAAVKPRSGVTASFYEWTPHNPDRLAHFATPEATTPGEWQPVSMEFTTPAWDPFVDLRIFSEGAVVHVDDLRFAVVEPTTAE